MSLTAFQLAEAFPEECAEFIPKVLPILKSKLLYWRERVKFIESMPWKDDDKKLYRLFIDFGQPQQIRKRIDLYEKTMEILNSMETDKFLADKHATAVAKAKPIENLYGFQKMKMTSSRVHASCPFHSPDAHPSFVIYRGNNTFHCFTCKASGDSIEFFMRLNKTTFKKTVEELSRWNT